MARDGVGGFIGLSGWWHAWPSCLGFLCPRGPGWGRKQSPGLLQLCPQPLPDLLPLAPPAASEDSGQHCVCGRARGGMGWREHPRGAESAHWGTSRKPSLAAFASPESCKKEGLRWEEKSG